MRALSALPVSWQRLPDGSVCLHGCAVCYEGQGLLVLGAPASGKSSYVCAMIGRGGTLIADDHVILTPSIAGPVLSAPSTIAGVLALRDHGLFRVPHLAAHALSAIHVLSEGWLNSEQALNVLGTPVVAHEVASAAASVQCLSLYERLPDDWMPKRPHAA